MDKEDFRVAHGAIGIFEKRLQCLIGRQGLVDTPATKLATTRLWHTSTLAADFGVPQELKAGPALTLAP